MPALNFKSRFVEAVVSGAKPHSFRAMRKRPFKAGDIISHFTGPRMKPRRIRSNTRCERATVMTINPLACTVQLESSSLYYPAGVMSPLALKMFAERDGFSSVTEMFQFFLETHGGLVKGQLVEWDPHAAVSGVFKPGAHQEETALGAAAVDAAAADGTHDAAVK